jgi:hypothetical protein
LVSFKRPKDISIEELSGLAKDSQIMKITSPLKPLFAVFTLGTALSMVAGYGALVINYNFEGTGASVANGGSLGSAADLATYNATDTPTNLRTTPGTGVGGSGSAIDFVSTPNASGPYGITSGPVSLNITTGFTISGWLDMATWSSGASVFRNNAGNFGMNLLLNAPSTQPTMQLTLGSGTASTNIAANANSFSGATSEGWVFFAITWDGSTVTFYRGDDKTSSSLSVVGSGSYSAGVANNTTSAFALGNTTGATNDRPLNGLMDDFRVYNNYLDVTAVNGVRLSAIPEPSQMALLGLGAVSCLVMARGRRRLSA